MSKIIKAGSKLAENAIDKAIVTSLSPVITPIGAMVVAKGKGAIIGILLLIFIMLTAVISGGGNKKVVDRQREVANSSSSGSGGANSPNTQSGTLPSGVAYKSLNVPYTNQWINKDGSYAPRNIVDDWEMGWMTCGATSSVMVAGYFGKLQFSDDKTLKEYVYTDKGQNLPNYCGYNGVAGGAFGVTARGYCNQSSGAGMIEYLTLIGLKTRYLGYSFSNIATSIDQGKPIILGISAPLGHILVIKGYTADGRVIVNDPFGDETKSTTTYSFSGENALYDLDSGLFVVESLIQVYQ
jgi:hypothetical protein